MRVAASSVVEVEMVAKVNYRTLYHTSFVSLMYLTANRTAFSVSFDMLMA